MAVLRNRTQSNFTIITNNILRDQNLGLTARGLLCTMLSLPDNWEFSEKGLAAIVPDGITKIRSAIKELQSAGYLHRERERDEKGRVTGWIWEVSSEPLFHHPNAENPKLENLSLDNPSLDNPNLENRDQLSTESSKNVSIKEKEIEIETTPSLKIVENTVEKGGKKSTRFVPPTREEVAAYIQEMGYGLDPDEFMDANLETDWTLKNGRKVKDWKARVRTFERNRVKWDKQNGTKPKPPIAQHTPEEQAAGWGW